jgi:hypothetical protein
MTAKAPAGFGGGPTHVRGRMRDVRRSKWMPILLSSLKGSGSFPYTHFCL